MNTPSMSQQMSETRRIPNIFDLFVALQKSWKTWKDARIVARRRREIDHIIKYGKSYSSAEEMHDDILGKKK